MSVTGSTPHPAALPPEVVLAQCRVERTRGSGPGGQRRNKVETAVRLTHLPTGLTAQAGERRYLAENQRVALRRLRVNLALQVRREPSSGGASALWRSRSRGGRLAINPAHDDFAALLAEALDAIAAHGFDVAQAASALAVSSTQLVKLLRHEPAALAQVNDVRRQRGLAPLR